LGQGSYGRDEKGGAMRRAFLIVGFNNWGKTTLVYDLFGKEVTFGHPLCHPPLGHPK
jgi:hypothetical protein